MENKVPLPTDNIFKFYALFGLLLFIFSTGSVVYVTNSSNDVVLSSAVEIEELKQIAKPSPVEVAKLAILQKKLEVTLSDKKFFLNAISVLVSISAFGMGYGFKKWHTEVQPVLDETAKIQLELAKLQLEKLRNELESKNKISVPANERTAPLPSEIKIPEKERSEPQGA